MLCSGTNGFVKVWYDQASTNDATQTATGSQPKIYDSTTGVVTENGKPAVQFDGSNDYVSTADFTAETQPFYFSLVASPDTTAISRFIDTNGTITNNRINITLNGSIYEMNAGNSITGGTTTTTQQLLTADFDTTNSFLYKDGVQIISGDAGTRNIDSVRIGANKSGIQSLNGTIQEVVFYNSDKSTDRTSIESNIGDYFTQNTPLLDTYTGAAAAYSLRKLSSSYSGALIRVRRSSDNAELDINANVFGELDTVSLLAFAGAGDAFVKTWYSQTGSNDATQTATGSQPKIVSSGAVIVENGKPAVEFDGSNDELPMSSTPLTSLTNYASFVARYTDTTVEGNLYGAVNGANNWAIGFNRGNANRYALRFYNGGHIQTGDNYDQAQALFTQTPTASTATVYKDGVLATQNYSARNGGGNVIGSKSGSYYFVGTIQEAIFYDSDQSSNRTNIETNINTFYSIT